MGSFYLVSLGIKTNKYDGIGEFLSLNGQDLEPNKDFQWATTDIRLLPLANGKAYVGSGYGTSTNVNSLDGEIAEVIIFDRLLTQNEQVFIGRYLSGKWGMASIIDSDGDEDSDSPGIDFCAIRGVEKLLSFAFCLGQGFRDECRDATPPSGSGSVIVAVFHSSWESRSGEGCKCEPVVTHFCFNQQAPKF